MSQIVKLNVGGVCYETTRAILSRDPNGMIAKMIEQPAEIQKINDGEELFIDRDGNVFNYVLNYLRDGESSILPNEFSKLQELRKEADFYQLQGLVRLVDILKRGGNFKVGDLITINDDPNSIAYFVTMARGVVNLRCWVCGHHCSIGKAIKNIGEVRPAAKKSWAKSWKLTNGAHR